MAFPDTRRAGSLSPTLAADRGSGDPGPAEAALARAQWQPTVYADRPRRADLLALQPHWPLQTFRLQVIRNHPFEFVASVLRPFLAFAGLEATIAYGDYDDSLAASPDPTADVIAVWLDFDRYQRLSPGELIQWLQQRLQRIRSGSSAPILLTNHATADESPLNEELEQMASDLPGTYVADQCGLARKLGPGYRDERTARLAGTTMSDLAALLTARQWGLSWLPALLLPPIKAIAVDLDETLYSGILGEDGPSNVRLTPDHLALQQRLVDLRKAGIFLAAVSRNEPADVDTLFELRADLPIRREDFSALAVSWRPKTEGLQRIAEELRIGVDAILYVDDNAGELASAASAIPAIRLLHAAEPALSSRALAAYPGLFRWSTSEADTLRIRDLAAARSRDRMVEGSQDPNVYLASLQVEIAVALDEPSHLQRVHELSQKTNQFNTGLHRFSAADVADYIHDPERHVISVALRDRLAESGIVGAVFLSVRGNKAIIDEVAISCRALGRRLERFMILAAIRRALDSEPVSRITFAFTPGPRNQPARSWLAALGGEGEITMPWRAADVAREIAAAPIRLTEVGT